MATSIKHRGWKLDADQSYLAALFNGTEVYRITASAWSSTLPLSLTYTSDVALTVNQATVGSDKRGVRFLFTVATPVMTTGYGVFETDLTVSGTGTGNAAAASTWLNVPSGATLASGANQLVHTDGIWEDSGATITGAHMAMCRYEAILGDSDFNNLNIWQLNFTQTISAMFDVNDPAKALGLVSGSTGAAVGSIPFFTTGAGGLKYIRVYDAI